MRRVCGCEEYAGPHVRLSLAHGLLRNDTAGLSDPRGVSIDVANDESRRQLNGRYRGALLTAV